MGQVPDNTFDVFGTQSGRKFFSITQVCVGWTARLTEVREVHCLISEQLVLFCMSCRLQMLFSLLRCSLCCTAWPPLSAPCTVSLVCSGAVRRQRRVRRARAAVSPTFGPCTAVWQRAGGRYPLPVAHGLVQAPRSGATVVLLTTAFAVTNVGRRARELIVQAQRGWIMGYRVCMGCHDSLPRALGRGRAPKGKDQGAAEQPTAFWGGTLSVTPAPRA